MKRIIYAQWTKLWPLTLNIVCSDASPGWHVINNQPPILVFPPLPSWSFHRLFRFKCSGTQYRLWNLEMVSGYIFVLFYSGYLTTFIPVDDNVYQAPISVMYALLSYVVPMKYIRFRPIYCNSVSMAFYSSAPITMYHSLLYSSVYMLAVCTHSLLLLGLYLGLVWLNLT